MSSACYVLFTIYFVSHLITDAPIAPSLFHSAPKLSPEIIVAIFVVSLMKKPRKENSAIAKIYLLAYNGIQTIGWSYLLFQLINFYINYDGTKSLYETVKWTVIIFQNAALLEVYHAAAKLVPSSPIITIQQVSSRIIVVCAVLIPTVGGQLSPGLPLALFAWSITEIIRYSYYAFNLLNLSPQIIIWLRYTTFIILYPIGVTGELLCLYGAQKEFGETGKWSMELPNSLNNAFSAQYALIFVMLLYIPLFPQLYLHMFAQRKKVLGGPGCKKAE